MGVRWWAWRGENGWGVKERCVVCVLGSMLVCPSCVIPQSNRGYSTSCVQTQNSPTLTLYPPLQLCLLPPQTVRLWQSIQYWLFPVFFFHFLVLLLTLSAFFSIHSIPSFLPLLFLIVFYFFLLLSVLFSSLLIRAICWRGRQRSDNGCNFPECGVRATVLEPAFLFSNVAGVFVFDQLAVTCISTWSNY